MDATEHGKSRIELPEKHRKKANKIANKMIRAFEDGIRDLNKLAAPHDAIHNHGVHLMIQAAARAAAWNAVVNYKRDPRPDYWETVCREALEKAKTDLTNRTMTLSYKVLATVEKSGEWQLVNRP